MERVHEGLIQLKEWLASGAYHESRRWFRRWPSVRYRGGERFRCGEPPAARPVCSHEVGVAELTDRRVAVVLPAIPKVAARKAAEDCGSAGVGALALQGIEDLLDRVSHVVTAYRSQFDTVPGLRRQPLETPSIVVCTHRTARRQSLQERDRST